MDKVLIFGVSGFTGKALLQYIRTGRLDETYRFIGTDRGEFPACPVAYTRADLLQPGAHPVNITRRLPGMARTSFITSGQTLWLPQYVLT